jgi:ATP-binding cassette, subfamily B, multidrug efflux pump
MLKNFQPIIPYFRENLRAICIGMVGLLLVDFLQLYIPRIIKRAVDGLTAGTATTSFLITCGAVIAGLAVLIAAIRFVWRILIFGNSRIIEKKLRERLYAHLQTLSVPYYQQTKTGELMAHAVNDVEAVRFACGMGLVSLVDGVVMGLAAIGFMMAINVKLTLIALLPMPFMVYAGRKLSKNIHFQFKRVQKVFADLTESVREAFAGVKVVKAYHREEWQRDRLEGVGQSYITANMQLARSMAFFFPIMVLFVNLCLAIVIWLGGGLTILGTITTGDFVAFMSYLNLLAWPMMAMGWVVTLIQRGSASMGRIRTILEEPPEIYDHPDPVPVERLTGSIAIRNLTFYHPGQAKPAMLDVSLTIKPEQTVLVVGSTGAGKTTLLTLLPRLTDSPPDTIFIDGNDIRRIPIAVLRGNIGLAPQESFLFSESIRGNLTLGAEGFTDDQLLRVLELTEFGKDIGWLSKGLDTTLGEKGLTLSGGQRQRLTIARAMLIDPPILILDDALSSVDTQTEKKILDNLQKERSGKLTIIVSHRVSTMRRADVIFVLKDGRLVEQGTHEELIAGGAEYRRLYRRQLLAEELEEAA